MVFQLNIASLLTTDHTVHEVKRRLHRYIGIIGQRRPYRSIVGNRNRTLN